MLTVTLYTRDGCKLCDEVLQQLQELQDNIPHRVVLIDIDKEELQHLSAEIPVIEVGPYKLQAPFDKQTLQITLAAAQDRSDQLEDMSNPGHQGRIERGRNITAADSFFYWLSKRYMLVFNLAVFLYLGLSFLAPVLHMNGAQKSAGIIYTVYSRLCHQLAFRSWFIEGEQLYYPREAAGLDQVISYQEATGNDPADLQTAQQLIGNPDLGYKVALCQRDVAIYGAILLFGIIFSLSGRKLPSLPVLAWVVLGMVPIGLDGVSQIVSQLPWDLIPYRESTPLLRTLTGALFGFTTAWFGYPLVEETMTDTRKVMAVKHAANQTMKNYD